MCRRIITGFQSQAISWFGYEYRKGSRLLCRISAYPLTPWPVILRGEKHVLQMLPAARGGVTVLNMRTQERVARLEPGSIRFGSRQYSAQKDSDGGYTFYSGGAAILRLSRIREDKRTESCFYTETVPWYQADVRGVLCFSEARRMAVLAYPLVARAMSLQVSDTEDTIVLEPIPTEQPKAGADSGPR